MILIQVESPTHCRSRTRRDRLQMDRPYLAQTRFPGRGLLPLAQARHRTGCASLRKLQRRQPQVPLGLKLQQKTTRGEVLEPSTMIPPAPMPAQLARQSFATPLWMIRYPLRQPTDLFSPEATALNQ